MKKRIFTLVFFFWWFAGGFAYPALGDDIVMGSGDWCPYVCDPARHDGKFGYLPDIARRVFERAGHTFDMQYLPFARVIQYVREGKLDGIPGVYRGDVPDFIFPAEPQGVGLSTFYVRNGTAWRYEGEDSLQELSRLGVIRNYYYGDVIQRFVQESRYRVDILHGVDPQRRSLRKLQFGRLAAWIEDRQVADYTIRTMHLEGKILPAGDLGDRLFVYVAFSPARERSRTYAQLLVTGVEELRQSGELSVILAAYGLHDWKEAPGLPAP